MHKLWYDFVKPKLCYMDKDCLIVYIKTKNIYSDIANDVEARLGNSNFELDKPLPKGKITY